ncbi:MAG: response regulator [Pseudomonadota bacterium]|mgnify:CR=1 FL=1
MSDSDTILIVDGDEAQARVLETAINNRLKYNTMIVTSGQKAINAVLPVNCVPSIMLLDMSVLQIDAIHVVNIIKHCKPDFPIIIMVEYGDTEKAVETINAGANDFLTKPLTIERLGLSIASALRTRNLYKMIERLEKQLEFDGGAQIASTMDVSQTLLAGDGTVKKLRHLEEDAIRYALNACGGSMSKAARSLGIGRSTLYRKVGELGRHKKQGHIVRENHITLPTAIMSDNELSYVE